MTKSETVRSRRPREHLTEAEIEKLMAVAKQSGRYGHRDATAILIAYRHGLRASELVGLQWDQIDFVRKTIRVRRVKNGDPSTHYLGNSELRALRATASAHVAAQLWLSLCQPGQGYALAAGLPRSPQHSIDRAVYDDGAGSIQGLGARLNLLAERHG